jgi:hypothetical protein
MKNLIVNSIITLTFVLAACDDTDEEPYVLNFACMKGEVIGSIRSAGGGLAVSLDKPYQGAVTWQGRNNVIELCNIPEGFQPAGTIIYFSSRRLAAGECGPVTADGDESIQTALYGETFSSTGCP